MRWFIYSLACLSIVALLTLPQGCEVDSATDVQRQLEQNFTGLYRAPSGGPIVTSNSGAPVTTLDVRQDGDRLQAIDNNQNVFEGSISEGGATFPFVLEGQTTAGKRGTFSGDFRLSGTTATMQGTWIEDDRYGTFLAQASVSAVSNAPSNSALDPLKWQGCCSDHGGIQVDASGLVVVNSSGFGMCNDGQPSPSCNVTNRN